MWLLRTIAISLLLGPMVYSDEVTETSRLIKFTDDFTDEVSYELRLVTEAEDAFTQIACRARPGFMKFDSQPFSLVPEQPIFGELEILVRFGEGQPESFVFGRVGNSTVVCMDEGLSCNRFGGGELIQKLISHERLIVRVGPIDVLRFSLTDVREELVQLKQWCESSNKSAGLDPIQKRQLIEYLLQDMVE